MGKLITERKSGTRNFLDQLGKHSVLSHEDMVATFKLYKDNGDAAARETLIVSNMRLVISIAKQFKEQSSTIPLEDLVQEGAFGLMTAVERFDWRRGYRFSTYATWWIRQAIGQFLLKKKRTIRLPAHAVTVQRYMISAAEQYRKQFGHEPTEKELIDIVSLEKNIRVSKTVVSATSHSGRGTLSLQAPSVTGPSTGAEPKTLEHMLPDESPAADPFDNVSSHELLQITRYVLSTLSPKEAAIIRLRFGLCEDPTDSDAYPISEEEMEAVMKGKGMT